MLTRIEIIKNSVIGQAVSGRELYKLIAVSKSAKDGFSDWFRQRQRQLNLIEGKDFVETTAPIEGKSRNGIEFIMSLSAAKQYCELATKGRGIGVVGFIEAYELNPAIADVAEHRQPTVSLFEPAPAKSEFISKYRSEVETPAETLPDEAPTGALTATQQRLKLMQEQLEQLQKDVEEEAKQQTETPSAPGTSEEILTMFDNRIDSIEGKVNVMLTFFEQATVALRGLSTLGDIKPEEVAPAEPTTRTLLVRLVNSFAAAERRTEHETWKYLYGQFDLRTGLNAYAVASNKTRDQTYLTVIEERGQIDKLYELARKLLVLPELK